MMLLTKIIHKYPKQLSALKRAKSATLSFLHSRTFFLSIVGLLIIQAIWMALTTRYPMAFDENYHFGVIKIYAGQWSPFITTTPPDSGVYGDLIRNPSYLYHYLLSFPYRFIALFIHQEAIQIVILRLINVGLFAAGLFAWRKLLLGFRFSATITNISLLMLVLIPVVPFLAGQINYDNLLFLLIPIAMTLTLRCSQALVRTNRLPLGPFISLLIVCMLASIVKYAFLPIFLALGLCLLVLILKSKSKASLLRNTLHSFQSLSAWMKISLIIGLIIAGGLFTERYAVNIIGYGSIEPDCLQLHSLEHCKQFGPWGRNYNLQMKNESATTKPSLDPTPALFPVYWIYGMMHRLYFAINYNYSNHPEPPIPILTSSIVGLIGLVLGVIFRRRLFAMHPYFFIAVMVTVVYVASLLYVNFSDYLHTRTMTAINGRYLILILPLLFAALASAYALFIQKVLYRHTDSYKLALLVVCCLLLLQGGGILTHVAQGSDDWYWQNQTVINIGRDVRDTVKPFIIGVN